MTGVTQDASEPAVLARVKLSERFGATDGQETLLHSIAHGADWNDVQLMLEGGAPGLYYAASGCLRRRIAEPEFQQQLCTFLGTQSPGVFFALKILASFNLPESSELEGALLKVARSDTLPLQEAAARAIVFRYPHLCSELLQSLNKGISLGLCYSENVDYIRPLLEYWRSLGDREIVLDNLGLLVTPQWLSECWNNEAELAAELCRRFGYIPSFESNPKAAVVDTYRQLLARGLMAIHPALGDLTADQVVSDESAYLRCLLPMTLGMNRSEALEFDDLDPTKVSLFLSAVRRTERENIFERRDDNPFAPKWREQIGWGMCCRQRWHLNYSNLVIAPIQVAKRLNVPNSLYGPMLIENATVEMESDERARTEARVYFEARWALAGKRQSFPGEILVYPISADDECPELADVVLPRRPRKIHTIESSLTAGATSLNNMLRYLNIDCLPVLTAIENHYARHLLPVGCETQLPFSKDRLSQSLPWKQAFRLFDVPSRRRPDFKALVEASFKPSASFHIQIASLLALRQLGFFIEEKMHPALHISLGADLGDRVGYLLLPNQFVGHPTLHAGLMSKGFARLHDDAVDLYTGDTAEPPAVRTELRSFRIPFGDLTDLRDSNDFMDAIAAAQLLGTASVSSDSTLTQIWGDYTGAINQLCDQFPVIGEVLQSNWYQGTGEPDEPKMVRMLPIVVRLREALKWIAGEKKQEEVREAFRSVRNAHAKRVFDALPLAPVITEQSTMFAFTKGEIPVLFPTELGGFGDG